MENGKQFLAAGQVEKLLQDLSGKEDETLCEWTLICIPFNFQLLQEGFADQITALHRYRWVQK